MKISSLIFAFCICICISINFVSALQPQDVAVAFWEPLPFADLPQIVTTRAVFHQDSSTQGKVYTVAGSDDPTGSTITVTNNVYEMNVATETWRKVPPSGDTLTGRVYHSAEVVTNSATGVSYVVVYGGYVPYDDTAYGLLQAHIIADFAILDLSTFTWTNKGKLVDITYVVWTWQDRTCCPTCDADPNVCPEARGGAMGAVFPKDPENYYLYGGQAGDGTVFLTDLWRYNVTADTWTKMTVSNPPSQGRISSAFVALNHSPKKRLLQYGGIYVQVVGLSAQEFYVGGELYMIEETAPDSWTFTLVFNSASAGPGDRSDPLYSIAGTILLIWGGQTPSTKATTGPMYVLNTSDTNTGNWAWQTQPTANGQFEPQGRSGSGLVFIPTQGAMTSFGGADSNGISTKQLYKYHADGLLPPVRTTITDVPEGYDFNVDPSTVTNFPDTAPNLVINTRPTAQDSTGAPVVGAIFGRLVERDSNNNEVQELLLPASAFVVGYELLDIAATNTKVTVFTRHGVNDSATTVVNNAATVRLEFFQFAVDTTVSNSPAPDVLVKAGELKFNIRLGFWPFLDKENTLRFEMQIPFHDCTAVTSSQTQGTNGVLHHFTYNNARGTVVTFNVVSNSVNDGVLATVQHTVNVDTVAQPPTASFTFDFQYFNATLHFDPTFGVLLDGETDGGDGDGGSDNTAIYIGVFVSFGVVALAFVIAVIVAIVTTLTVLYKRKMRRARLSAVSKGAADIDVTPD